MAKERSFAMIEGERTAQGFSSLPIDPFRVASDENIEVVEKNTEGGVSGLFIRTGDSYTIVCSTHLRNEGFERFSIAHELGHYCLPGHIDQMPMQNGIHKSRAGKGQDRFEREADEFAAGLLMPRRLFVPAMDQVEHNLLGIKKLAKQCKTSLLATARRLIECTDEHVAMHCQPRGENPIMDYV